MVVAVITEGSRISDKNRIVAAAGFLAFAGVSILLLKLAGITPEFFDSIVLKTMDISFAFKLPFDIRYLAAGLIFFPLSLAFVAVYALRQEKIDWTLAGASAALFVLTLALLNIGPTSIAIGLGIFLAPIIIQYGAIDDKKAYKELRPGRIASKAAGTAFLVLSILVAISVFYVTSSDTSYSDKAVDSMVDAMVVLAVGGENAGMAGQAPSDAIKQQVKAQVSSMPLFAMLKTYYPHLSAITAFSAIQFAGIVFLAPMAGFYAWILWKFAEKDGGAVEEKK